MNRRARPSSVATASGLLALTAATGAVAAGPPASAFVPDGFSVERRVAARFGGDARPDLALVLTRRVTGTAPDGGPARAARRLVLLKARSDGGYVRIGEGRRILLCTRCGGAFFGVALTPVTVRVRSGVVIAEQESGSRVIRFTRFRIRSEGAVGTRLIGVDVRTRDRLTGARVETSTNLLTGRRIVVRVDGRGRRTERRTSVPVRTIPLEAVRHTRYR